MYNSRKCSVKEFVFWLQYDFLLKKKKQKQNQQFYIYLAGSESPMEIIIPFEP